jgi:uncharacterized SAM-binding protein YcdF (DUF218 family)
MHNRQHPLFLQDNIHIMFFILSKLLLFCINPVNWLLIIIITALFITKSAIVKKRLWIGAILLTLIFGNRFLYNRLVLAWQPKPVELHNSYQVGIVLGGFTSFDRHNMGFFNQSSDRFIETAKLYHQGIIKKIIVSGGNGSLDQSRPKEAGFVRGQLIQQMIPPADIYFENQSRNTYENAQNCKKILDSLHVAGPVILITSAMHIPRAKNIFEKTGYEILPYPANYEEIDMKFSLEDYFIPDLDTLSGWQKFLKEVIGLLIYNLTGKG